MPVLFLVPVLFLDEAELLAVFAGIFRVAPARSASDVMPLAAFNCATVTPYFLDMVDSDSPLFILWVVGLAGAALAVFSDLVVAD